MARAPGASQSMNTPNRLDAIIVPEGVKKITATVDERLANASTFRVMREDHTVGNLVRMQMLRDPKVRFCGYRIPHPLEKDIEVLVQVKDGTSDSPLGALERTVTHLESELRWLQEKYRNSLRELQRRRELEFDE
mmetsp:Transcript_175046/g.425936  ORF Transcript_175046/g.425936 Transcript_175046/m.425936 type:complete len:135 (-) Transcript_175046:493-897(-)